MTTSLFHRNTAIIISILLLLVGSVSSKKAFADEIVISGNGAESVSVSHTSTDNQTSVESTNITNVDNNVDVSANTGNNSASNNAGTSTGVTTGDISTTTEISNTGNVTTVNPSGSTDANGTAQGTCCREKGSLTIISGNGSGSKNTANISNTNTTNITVNQTANIANTIIGNANTGNNIASNNSGNVLIKTGSISVRESIKNAPVNLTWISAALARNIDANLKIVGNGTESVNALNLYEVSDVTISINNIANIINNSSWDLTTGNNKADNNVGDVTIITGDIDVKTEIVNSVNESTVTVDCGCHEKPQPKPTPVIPTDKVTPPTHGEGSSNHGEVASVSMGKSLPSTGISWLLLAFVGNVMMLLLGMILRLRSGNAPGVTVA